MDRIETETETKTLLAISHNYGVEFKCTHERRYSGKAGIFVYCYGNTRQDGADIRDAR